MNTQQTNIQIVKDAYAAFGQGDMERLMKDFSEDIHWWVAGPSDVIPFAGEHRGREEVKRFFRILDQYQQTRTFQPKDFVAQGDQVIVLGHYHAQVKKTGRDFDYEWVHVFTLRGEKIAQFREYYDTAAVVEAYRPQPAGANV